MSLWPAANMPFNPLLHEHCMASQRMCPRCGKAEQETEFLEGFCSSCFPEVRVLAKAPDKLELPECPRCGRAFLAGVWTELTGDVLHSWIAPKVKSVYPITKIRVHLEGTAAYRVAVVEATLDIEGNSFKYILRIPTPVDKRVCKDDLKLSQGYFESIIQIRGDEEKVERLAQRAIKLTEKFDSFITKQEEVRNGIDLYIGSNTATHNVITAIGKPFETSRELGGVRQGKKVYRVTYLIRV